MVGPLWGNRRQEPTISDVRMHSKRAPQGPYRRCDLPQKLSR